MRSDTHIHPDEPAPLLESTSAAENPKPFGREQAPTQKTVLMAYADCFVRHELALPPELEPARDAIALQVAQCLSKIDDDVIAEKRKITTKSNNRIFTAARETFSAERGIDMKVVTDIQSQICSAINFLMYRNYIRRFLDAFILYCQNTDPPKQWKLASIARWPIAGDARVGKDFYQFWIDWIEKSDAIFQKIIVENLPEHWRNAYEPLAKESTYKPRACPYQWNKMSDEEIGILLDGLKQSQGGRNPSTGVWYFESVEQWLDAQQRPIGRFFNDFWFRKFRGNSVKNFEERILPKLSEAKRKNFKRIKQYAALTHEQLAEVITGLKPDIDPAANRWGPHSIDHWVDSDGRKVGFQILAELRRRFGNKGQPFFRGFRQHILPHLRPEWQLRYVASGERIDLRPSTAESLAAAEATGGEVYALLELAQAGNRDAYFRLIDRMTGILTHHFGRDDISVQVLEGCISHYKRELGAFLSYCYLHVEPSFRRRYDAMSCRRSFFRDDDDRGDGHPRFVDPKSLPRDDFDEALGTLAGAGIEDSLLEELTTLLQSGFSLKHIASNGHPRKIKQAAQKVQALLAE